MVWPRWVAPYFYYLHFFYRFVAIFFGDFTRLARCLPFSGAVPLSCCPSVTLFLGSAGLGLAGKEDFRVIDLLYFFISSLKPPTHRKMVVKSVLNILFIDLVW